MGFRLVEDDRPGVVAGVAVGERLHLDFVPVRWTEADLAAVWDLVRVPRVPERPIRDFRVCCPAAMTDAFDGALDLPEHVRELSVHAAHVLLWSAMCVARLPGVRDLELVLCSTEWGGAHRCADDCADEALPVFDAVRFLMEGAPNLRTLRFRFCGRTLAPMGEFVRAVEECAPPSLRVVELTCRVVDRLRGWTVAAASPRGIRWTKRVEV